MTGVFFADNPLFSVYLSQPGTFLFGCLVFVFGITITLACLIKRDQKLVKWFTVGSFMSWFLLFGIVVLDFFGASGAVSTMDGYGSISELLSTHRWLLMQVPLLLVTTASLVTLFYGKELTNHHAKEYLFIVQGSLFISILTIFIIGLESFI